MVFFCLVSFFVGLALGATPCDNFNFSPFQSAPGCGIGLMYLNAQGFNVSSPSLLTGGTLEVGTGVTSVGLTLWVSNSSSFPSFLPQPVLSWSINVSQSLTPITFSLPESVTYALEPGITYAFGALSVGGSSSQAIPCLNANFPLSSVRGSFQLVGSSYCLPTNGLCAPNLKDGYPALLYFAPTICQIDCSGSSTCDSCTNAGCAWCEDTDTCGKPSLLCRSQVTQPKYCPLPDCTSLSRCPTCANEPACVWCLNSNNCEFYHNGTCQNRIGDPSKCPH